MSNKTIKVWDAVDDGRQLEDIANGADALIHLKKESNIMHRGINYIMFRGVIYFTSISSSTNFGVLRVMLGKLGRNCADVGVNGTTSGGVIESGHDMYNALCTINHVPVPSEYGVKIRHLREDLYTVYHLDEHGLPIFTRFSTEQR